MFCAEIHDAVGSGIIGAGARAKRKEGFVIEVLPKRAGIAGAQHDVTVTRKGNDLVAVPEKLSIEVGDFVLWHTPDASVGAFSVAGQGPDVSFSSGRMVSDAIYTHAFGAPGQHNWMDPLGRKLSGVVEVRAFEFKTPQDPDRWYEMLSKPAGFEITAEDSKPKSVEIVVGQTVFWSVQKTGGVAITDALLVPSPGGPG